MDSSAAFRSSLRRRLLSAFGTALIAGPLGCAGTVIDSGSGGANGSSGTDSSSAGDGSGTSTSSEGTSGCSLTTTGTGGTLTQTTECFQQTASDCPNELTATEFIIPSDPCSALQSVNCGPVEDGNGNCCYVVTEESVGCLGRPFVVDGSARAAVTVRGSDGRGWSADVAPPGLSDLTFAERRSVADGWTRDALAEHASIASFARFALDLLAHGAPASLVEAAHAAAIDEVNHARLAFALASAYAGTTVAPGRFPTVNAATSSTLADLAAATARESCIGETVSALVAAEQLARTTDPAARAALTIIAADEARHAELAWKTVAWALEVGGEDVRHAVSEVLRAASDFAPPAGDPPRSSSLDAVRPDVLGAHGRLDVFEAKAVVARALAEVVAPCAARLLGSAAYRRALAS